MDGKSRANKAEETKVTTVFKKADEALKGINVAMGRAQAIHSKLYGTPQEEKPTAETASPNAFFDRMFSDLNEMNSLLKDLNDKLDEIHENL